MHSFGIRVFEKQKETALDSGAETRPARRGQAGDRLRLTAAVLLTLSAGMPCGYAQQATVTTPTANTASDLPAEPEPVLTEPLNLRASQRDFSKAPAPLLGNPLKWYMPTKVPGGSFQNSPRLADLVKNGKIYLSLSDALALALENNYDIAISRYYMDLADLDILRAKAGQFLQGSGATVNSFTQGGYSSTTGVGGGPGAATGGAAAGSVRRRSGAAKLYGPEPHGGAQVRSRKHALQQLLYRRIKHHQHL